MSLISREKLEEFENLTLQPHGLRSGNTRGRVHAEDKHPYRTAFQRDRDRILHTTAFRRLEYKTQVFVTTEGDYYRTRLTHTLEVAQVGRTIARALGGNEDLVEAICLAHDLGHPPFGHAGEAQLGHLMTEHGGFDHNKQSLRIVTELEERFPNFRGLNLTWEVREGIVKHETEYDVSDAEGYEPEKRGHLEAQISNVADELAYTAHDLDDGLRSGLIQVGQLEGVDLWDELRRSIQWPGTKLDDLIRHRLIRRLIGIEVTDIVETSSADILTSGTNTPTELQLLDYNIVGFSQALGEKNRQLKEFLYQNMYQHHKVVRMQTKAERIVADLFEIYTQTPQILPKVVQQRAQEGHFHRTICDYIAGMTDRFALKEHNMLFDAEAEPSRG